MRFGRILLKGAKPLREVGVFRTPHGEIHARGQDLTFDFSRPTTLSCLSIRQSTDRSFLQTTARPRAQTDSGPLPGFPGDGIAAVWANAQSGILVFQRGDTTDLIGWGSVSEALATGSGYSPAIWGIYERLFGQRWGFLAAGLDAHPHVVDNAEPIYTIRTLHAFQDSLVAVGLFADLEHARDIHTMGTDIWWARNDEKDIVASLAASLRYHYDMGTPIPDVPSLPAAQREARIAAAVERHPW